MELVSGLAGVNWLAGVSRLAGVSGLAGVNGLAGVGVGGTRRPAGHGWGSSVAVVFLKSLS